MSRVPPCHHSLNSRVWHLSVQHSHWIRCYVSPRRDLKSVGDVHEHSANTTPLFRRILNIWCP